MKVFIKKLSWLLIVLFGITIISFSVIHLAPGSPTELQTNLNPLATDALKAKLDELYGLNKPLLEQYFDWLSRMIRLDFGYSMSSDARPVIDKILERLPLTLSMNVISLALTLIIALPIGIISAYKQGTFIDKFLTLLVFLGFAMPSFWLALLCMIYFGIELAWFPISGLTSFNYDTLSNFDKFKDIAWHLTMPILIGTIGSIAGASRFARSSMLEVLRQDYILTARAKGLSETKILFHHAFRNALLPIITLLGLSIPGLIGGSVIIESIFALPGLGQLFYSGVMSRDYPLIMGNLVIGAFLTLVGNLLADVSYALADPRIRYSEKQGDN